MSEFLAEAINMVAKNCVEMANEIKTLKERVKVLEQSRQAAVSGSLPNDRKRYMRKQATTIFELTKGFTGEPTSNAMKAALEMAGYVQELTTDVE